MCSYHSTLLVMLLLKKILTSHESSYHHTVKAYKQEELWNKALLNSATYLYCCNLNWVSAVVFSPFWKFKYHIHIAYYWRWKFFAVSHLYLHSQNKFRSYQLLQTFIVFTCMHLPKNFRGCKVISEKRKTFSPRIISNIRYTSCELEYSNNFH